MALGIHTITIATNLFAITVHDPIVSIEREIIPENLSQSGKEDRSGNQNKTESRRHRVKLKEKERKGKETKVSENLSQRKKI